MENGEHEKGKEVIRSKGYLVPPALVSAVLPVLRIRVMLRLLAVRIVPSISVLSIRVLGGTAIRAISRLVVPAVRVAPTRLTSQLRRGSSTTVSPLQIDVARVAIRVVRVGGAGSEIVRLDGVLVREKVGVARDVAAEVAIAVMVRVAGMEGTVTAG